MRSEGKPNRSKIWTAWDANTKWFRQPSRVRKKLRRWFKRSEKNRIAKELEE